jgi:hypothetical protein
MRLVRRFEQKGRDSLAAPSADSGSNTISVIGWVSQTDFGRTVPVPTSSGLRSIPKTSDPETITAIGDEGGGNWSQPSTAGIEDELLKLGIVGPQQFRHRIIGVRQAGNLCGHVVRLIAVGRIGS